MTFKTAGGYSGVAVRNCAYVTCSDCPWSIDRPFCSPLGLMCIFHAELKRFSIPRLKNQYIFIENYFFKSRFLSHFKILLQHVSFKAKILGSIIQEISLISKADFSLFLRCYCSYEHTVS